MADNTNTAVKFTEAQENAINAQNSTLLVAAGAGSGKTSVLTERIIKKICAGGENYNITDFLVVTFTRASAADLKNKISKAINNRLSVEINNVHLKRQQILLGRASISTIHSFCLDLIRSNFEKLGIPAKFRMFDENELSLKRREILDELLEKYYNADSEIYKNDEKLFGYQAFTSSLENFIGSRDDENMYAVIFRIYDKIISQTEPFKLFDMQIEIMNEINDFDNSDNKGGFFETKFGAIIKDSIGGKIAECLSEAEKMIGKVQQSIDLDKKYDACFSNIYNFFCKSDAILTKKFGTYDDIYNLCEEYEHVKVGNNKLKEDYELELKEHLDKKIAVIRKTIADIQKLFSHDFADIKRFAETYKKSLIILCDFMRRFDENLKAEKMRLKTFDFSDLERFAFQLLVEKIGEDGEIFVTDLARQVKNSYKEIYIDEYQDTNKLQDIIFKSISTEQSGSINGNRFMVGDIKQSIYAFRGAKSDIFANYSKLFAEYDKNNNDTGFIPQKIYLRKNFRSSYNIISFINYIFANLFSENLGGMEYTGGEVLDVGRIFADEETDKSSVDVTFAIVEKGGDEAVDDETPEEPVGAESISARGFSPDVDSNLRAEIDSAPTQDNTPETQILSTEAEYIALTVKKLLAHGKLKNGENILPRHITILMRNYTKSDLYIDALKRHGIACYTDKSKGFLGSAEIMLIVSLLRTIDNPMRDIDLTAVLKSPVFGFNLDDLIYIKRFNLNSEYTGVVSSEKNDDLKLNALDEYIDPLFRYIRLYAEYDDGIVELKNKCHNFMAKLNQWRAKSRILSVDKFIWYLYRQTDIMAKISLETFAPERKANLMLLYEYARKFESTTFKGLYEFLDYLNDIQSGKNDLERAKVISENSDVVRVMSVHKSKGLEFPVCILANTSGLFNRSDYLGNPVISDDGIYFDLKYKDEIGTEKTPFKKLVAEKVKREVVSEEARILYVALTRAIEKLIIVGNVDNIENYLQKNTVTGDDGTALTSLLSGADNALKWLTPILLNSDGTNKTNPAVNFNIDFVNAVKLNQMIANQRNEDLLAQNLELTGEELSESDLETIDEYGKKLKEMYDFKYKFSLLSKIPLKLSVTNLSPVGAESISARAFSPDVGSNTPEYSEPEMAPLPRFLENEADDVAILRGTATHLFMQYADFEYAEVFGAQNEAENLLSKEFITEPQYDRIKFDSVDKFFGSDLYQKIKSAKKIYREMPFHLKISVADLIKMNNIGAGESLNFVQQVHLKDLEELPEYSEDFLLIQGAIDLFFEDKDGNVYVVDFKTDYVRSDEGENILVKRHKRQIEYYCKAVQAILNKPVSGAYIYSFSLNKAVEVAVGDIN